MWKLAKYLKHYKKEVILGPLFKLTEAVLELIAPLIMANIIDVGIKNSDSGYILRMGGLMILIAAIGRAKFITADMVKPGAVVVDVGMNRDENGKLCGDVDFASVEPVASYITPVPGGVGPMTITMLLENTIRAAKLQNGLM